MCGGSPRCGHVRAVATYDVRGTWLATTDADSVVPAHWLMAQLRHTERGARMVAGTVAVQDWQNRSPPSATAHDGTTTLRPTATFTALTCHSMPSAISPQVDSPQ